MSWVRRGLGYLKDSPKLPGRKLDHQMHARASVLPPAAPSSDLRHLIVSVLDQGQLGSCVAQAIAQGIRMCHVRDGSPNAELISRLLLYGQARDIQGTFSEDSGLEPRNAFDALRLFGFAPESSCPYDVARFADRPSPELEQLAYDQRDASAIDYCRVDGSTDGQTLDLIRRCLTAGMAVTFGGAVSEAFAENALDFTNPIPPPRSVDVAGLHELLIVGHDADGNFLICNSWGSDFGIGGFCRFTQSYVVTDSDRWCLVQAPNYSETREAA